jgi:hypothetical protein
VSRWDANRAKSKGNNAPGDTQRLVRMRCKCAGEFYFEPPENAGRSCSMCKARFVLAPRVAA